MAHAGLMPNPKTTSERVAALRAVRESQGLKRREVYAHDDDWPKIKVLAEALKCRRVKQ